MIFNSLITWIKRNWFWISVFIFLWIFFILVPLTGDDFTFFAYHNNIHGFSGYIDANNLLYKHINGRVVGNMLALILVKNIVIAGLVRAGVVWFIMFSTVKLISQKSIFVRNISVFAIFVTPLAIFKETYAWRAGFYNYVVPVAVIAAVIWCIYLFHKSKSRHALVYLAGAAVLSMTASLFVENITLGWVCTTIAFLVISIIKYRKVLIGAIITSTTSIIGALIMFGSPVYSTIAKGGDSYRHISSGGHGVLGTIKTNILSFTHLYIANNELLLIVLAIITLALIYKSRAKLPVFIKKILTEAQVRSTLTILLVILPIYLIASTHFTSMKMLPNNSYNIYLAFELFIVILFILTVIISIFTFVKVSRTRYISAAFLAASLLYTGSLLAVHPFGGRNFYVSYVCIVITTILLGTELFESMIKKHESRYLRTISYSMLVSVAVIYISIFSILYLRQQKNIALAQQQTQQGKKDVVLRKYPFDSFIYDSHNGRKATPYYAKSICTYASCRSNTGIVIEYK